MREAAMFGSHNTNQRFEALELLQGCPAEELERFDSLSTELTVAAGKTLLHEGTVGRQWLVVIEGTVSLWRAGSLVGTVEAGASLGGLALLDRRPQDLTVVAETPVTLWVFNHGDFACLLGDAPTLRGRVLAAAETERIAAETVVRHLVGQVA